MCFICIFDDIDIKDTESVNISKSRDKSLVCVCVCEDQKINNTAKD